ncbi:MAG: endonuclease/exonuclease/phosphatase family protein [Myxococcaceae bacterium]
MKIATWNCNSVRARKERLLGWYGRLRRYLNERYKSTESIVVCGDFNVAPEPIDVHDPKLWTFSWWDYRMLAFPKNRGLRIDYLLMTVPLYERCKAVEIDRERRKGKLPSDHAPVWAEI